MYIDQADLLHTSNVMFMSNEASLGGAVYVSGVDDKQTIFSKCFFESNEAAAVSYTHLTLPTKA